ncbi:MAG: tRNA (adenosine(37)-N6)-threonylcarbamoyltransferase complex ATPase subunit type 1 TsaE [Bacteroidales bacterium]|nr:tRNA (adenosine(37)-N6)-threonylcarbamoyltransferase complex ATPase subunit type 1 TsaE [Bacteroidales bacterium]
MIIQFEKVYLTDIPWVARIMGVLVQKHPVMAFYGQLGAGKTTLICHLVEALGGGEANIGSPTFAIIHQYESKDKKIYHVDAYRLSNEKEALEIGLHEILEDDSIVLIEWAEKLEGILADVKKINVRIKDTLDPLERKIIIELPHE